jgi:hypothetical protein
VAVELASGGLAVDRHRLADPRGEGRHEAPKQASNALGSSRRNRREKVSWLGIPPGKRMKRRRNGALASPNSAMSTQVSAPHNVEHNAISRISSKSWRCALPVRGSAKSAKHARNRSILPLPSHSGQPKQIRKPKDSTNS